MAQTPAEVRAQIEQTRTQLSETIDTLSWRIQRTRRFVPFYGMDRRQALIIAGGASLAFLTVFVALYARQEGFLKSSRRFWQLRR